MPGIRRNEIEKLYAHISGGSSQTFKLEGNFGNPQLIFKRSRIKTLYGYISEFEISRDTHQALAEVEFAFICSGTATLESALIGTPFVLVYIAKRLDYFIASKLLNISHVGLANILLNAFNSTTLHTELLLGRGHSGLLNEYKTSIGRFLFIRQMS